MSQFDFGTIDPNSKSGAQLALDLNKFRDALNSGHKGSVRPSYAQAGMLWVREVSSAQWDIMFFDGDSDFVLRSVNPTTNTLIKIPKTEVAGITELESTVAALDNKYVAKDSTTGAAIIPSGTVAQRPAVPSPGMFRYNTSVNRFERRVSSNWLNHGDMDGPLNEAAISTLSSSSIASVPLSNNTISVTGTSTITTLGSSNSGIVRRLIFTTVLQITHDAAALILPSGANITTAVGDVAEFVCLGSSNWRCLYYQRASGEALSSRAIGVGQTWQNMGSARTANTTYTNSTSNTIVATITGSGGSTTNYTIDGSIVAATVISGGGSPVVTLVIPPGSTYSAGPFSKWWELR